MRPTWRHYLFAVWRTTARAVTTSLPILAAAPKVRLRRGLIFKS
jgi:hypothetical protein